MKFYVTFILLLISTGLFSQQYFDAQKGDPVLVTMRDGNTLKGIYKGLDSKEIFLDLGDAGVIPIRKGKIESIVTISDFSQKKIIDRRKWAENNNEITNPLYSKYYVTETALGLSKGESYYQNILLFGHIVSHGVTDNFSVTLGTESVSILLGETPGIYANAKMNSSFTGSLNVAGGMIGGIAPTGEERFGSFYGVLTLGDRENNVSGGISYFIASDNTKEVIYQIGLMLKLTERISFVLDNGSVRNEGSAFVPALRWKSNKVALDFGFATNFEDGAFPVAAAAIKF